MLSSKTALVTGSTSGIGLAIAQTFAKNGANVVINGFGDAEAIEKERAGIEKEHGVKCVYSGADMTKPDEIAAMMGEAVDTFGAIDILVNCVGIQREQKILEVTEDSFDLMYETNLKAAMFLVTMAVPSRASLARRRARRRRQARRERRLLCA